MLRIEQITFTGDFMNQTINQYTCQPTDENYIQTNPVSQNTDPNPRSVISAAVDEESKAKVDQALIDPEFEKQLVSQLEETNLQAEAKNKDSFIADELEQLGEKDSMGVSLKAKVTMGVKTVEGQVSCQVVKTNDGYEMTIAGKVGLGLSAELAKGKGRFKVQMGASVSVAGEKAITLTFPNAQEVDKAIKLAGKVAITQAAIAVTATMPPVSYLIATKGSRAPVIGKYLVDVNNIPKVDCKLKSIELTDSLTVQGNIGGEIAFPVKGLETLAKGHGGASVSGDIKAGAKIEFDDQGNPTLVLRAGAGVQTAVEGKGGIGKYNRLVSSNRNDTSRTNVWIENRYPIDKSALADFTSDPVGSVKKLVKEASVNKETVVTISSATDDLGKNTGTQQALVIRPVKVGDVFGGEVIEKIVSGDLEGVKQSLDEKKISNEYQTEDYEVCGDNLKGEAGVPTKLKVEVGVAYGHKDVGGNNGLCAQ